MTGTHGRDGRSGDVSATGAPGVASATSGGIPLVDLGADPGAEPAGVAETHISVVVFAGSRAYKVCKAVDLGFLDYTTRERRRAALERELVLNRRFAPDVYLGLLDLVDATGEVHDHVLVMPVSYTHLTLPTICSV